MRLKKELLFKRKILNIIQSFLIIGSTLILLALAAFLIFGVLGAVSVIAGWLVLIFLIPVIDSKRVLKMYDGVFLNFYEAPGLYNGVYNLAKNANLKNPPKLYYIKSGSYIAFSTGTRNDPVIALSDGILRVLEEDELYGVLAHEISHIKNNDIWIMQLSDTAARIAVVVAYIGQFIMVVLSPFLLLHDALYFWILFILFLAIPPVIILMQLSLSRIREYGADVDAVMLTNDPNGLKNALLKINIIEEGILSRIFNPFHKPKEPSFLRTHPDTKSRVERLDQLNCEDGTLY